MNTKNALPIHFRFMVESGIWPKMEASGEPQHTWRKEVSPRLTPITLNYKFFFCGYRVAYGVRSSHLELCLILLVEGSAPMASTLSSTLVKGVRRVGKLKEVGVGQAWWGGVIEVSWRCGLPMCWMWNVLEV